MHPAVALFDEGNLAASPPHGNNRLMISARRSGISGNRTDAAGFCRNRANHRTVAGPADPSQAMSGLAESSGCANYIWLRRARAGNR
jgi:hypothetical protein